MRSLRQASDGDTKAGDPARFGQGGIRVFCTVQSQRRCRAEGAAAKAEHTKKRKRSLRFFVCRGIEPSICPFAERPAAKNFAKIRKAVKNLDKDRKGAGSLTESRRRAEQKERESQERDKERRKTGRRTGAEERRKWGCQWARYWRMMKS